MLPVGSRNKNSHWDYETGCTQDCCVTSNMKTSSNLKVIFHSSAQCLFFFFLPKTSLFMNMPSRLWHYSVNPQQRPSRSEAIQTVLYVVL